MEGSRVFPFAGNLDPRAQEFIPLNPIFSPFPVPYTSPPEPRSLTFFNLTPHPMMFSSPPPLPQPPPPPPPPPRPYFSGVSLPIPSNSPTRSISLISVPRDVTESTVRRDLELFGDVRGVQMERILEGIVTVHFYDIRDAKRAVREVCGRHMQQQARLSGGRGGGRGSVWSSQSSSSSAHGLVSGRPVWAQFVVPATSAVPGGCNQGTLVIFNLDPQVSSITLRQIFQVYGPIKELRETPYKKHQKFVEFYDVRDAATAFDRMNGAEIGGKQVVIEFSRPGGLKNKFRSSRLPFQPPPPILTPPMRQSLTLMQDQNNSVIPNNAVNASMRLLSIIDDVNKKNRGTESKYEEGKSKNIAKWGKKRQMKNIELSQFLISEEPMEDSSSRDPRTTLMIKNIPNKYSRKLLLDMLDNHCIRINEVIAEENHKHESLHQPFSSYDFVYLPMDFNNKCNVGYGFVNMTSPEAAWRFYKSFHLQHWEIFNSRKICQITYARVQGLEDLKEHFKSSNFPSEAELYLPVVFSPPRDGKQLTEPVTININSCTTLDLSHLGKMDGQDCSMSGSCCDSDQDKSNEDGLSGNSIDGARSITVEGETSF